MISRKLALCLSLCGATLLGACATPNTNGAVYVGDHAMRAQHVQTGTITAMRPIEMRSMQGNSDRTIGVIAGGLAGAVIGDQFGNGLGNTVMTGAGAIAGAAAGDAIAQRANRVPAQEWTIRLDNGATIAVIQNDTNLFVGQHVRIINDGTRTRIAY